MKRKLKKKATRCIKATVYIYMPDEQDEWNDLRNYSAKLGQGRIEIYDENNKKQPQKLRAFTNVGAMLDILMVEYRKRVLSRVKTVRQKIKDMQ